MASLSDFRNEIGSLRAGRQTADLRPPRYRPVLCGLALLATDTAAIIGLGGLSVRLLPTATDAESIHYLSGPINVALLVPCVVLVLYLAVRGRYHARLPFWTDQRVATCAGLFAAAAILLGSLLLGHVAAFGPAIAVLAAFPLAGGLANWGGRRLTARSGIWAMPALLAGDGPCAAEAEAAMTAGTTPDYRIVGRVGTQMALDTNTPGSLSALLRRVRARRLLIALDGEEAQRQLVAQALRDGVSFLVVLPSYALPPFGCEVTRPLASDATVLAPLAPPGRRVARLAKAALDVMAAASLLVLMGPLLLLIAALNRCDGGPALFAHRRIGAGGRPFNCLKFRTMVVDSDRVLERALTRDPELAAEWAATRKLRNDPRVTRLGRFLRRTSLDELPQLINVLKLDMSLVGPRPIVAAELPLYGDDIAHYYATRPGLTGLWQVSGRSNTSYQRRVQLDVWYVSNWTLWSDIVLLLKTIPAVLAGDGAH
jgi:undecaprenyl-phosphate galactose phosphotransferase